MACQVHHAAQVLWACSTFSCPVQIVMLRLLLQCVCVFAGMYRDAEKQLKSSIVDQDMLLSTLELAKACTAFVLETCDYLVRAASASLARVLGGSSASNAMAVTYRGVCYRSPLDALS